MSRPLVSVCIVTFQHARFIAQAVEGALMQKTNFPVEILIGEDESTDGTREICLDYAKRYPDRVRVFLRSRRDVVHIDGHPRGGFNFRMTLHKGQGEFLALCEGDDYWTDPEKLQRQVDYLRANPGCVGCFHDTKLVGADGQTLLESYFQSDRDLFTQQDVLETLLSREPTCSLVFRKSAFSDPLPEWYLRRPSDLYLDILLTNYGSLGFIRRNMGAYRKHAGGIWSGQRESDKIIELIIRYKLLLADSSFEKYKDLLLQKIGELQSTLFTRKDAAGEIERLERVVQEQTEAVKATQAECDRLSTEAKVIRTEAARAAKIVREQTEAVRATHAECDRLSTEANVIRAEAARAAATSQQQATFIAILEKERDRLFALGETGTKDIEHYIKVIQEQTAYIKALEAQRATTPRG